MKHFQSMTEAALSAACDDYDDRNQMNDLTADAKDERRVAIYFRHNPTDVQPGDPSAWMEQGFEREVIGVVIGGGFNIALDREQAVEVFGLPLVMQWEEAE